MTGEPRGKPHSYTTKRAFAWAILGVIALAGIVWGVRYVFPTDKTRFVDAYRRLEVGQTAKEVERIFGRSPDRIYLFKKTEIWYFRSPGEESTTKPLPLASGVRSKIASLSELPDAYNYVQVAFGRHGRSFAYTWIGEDEFVHTEAGRVRTDLRSLGGDDF